ncbi:hypothetical protein BGZ80_008030, partial [Entomortierella chlamydospora]
LSPKHPYPHAINEIVASYRDLVRQYGVNPRQIILGKLQQARTLEYNSIHN